MPERSRRSMRSSPSSSPMHHRYGRHPSCSCRAGFCSALTRSRLLTIRTQAKITTTPS